MLILALFTLASFTSTAHAVDDDKTGAQEEPIPYLQRYKPTFFLMGKPITKVQLSFQIEPMRGFPLHFGYTQLMMWDLFKDSAPFRDQNYNPELFYRFKLEPENHVALDLGAEHESNGKADPDSRSWNRVYLRYTQAQHWDDKKTWWALKVWFPYSISDETKKLLEHRGVWEAQFAISDLFQSFFQINELILRVYAGGRSRLNPAQGGQELTYREKESKRRFLLPLYFQIFHGYGENQLDAGENRWGLRAGLGF